MVGSRRGLTLCLLPLAACSLVFPIDDYDRETRLTCADDLKVSSAHCGACDHDCAGAKCNDGLCAPQFLVPLNGSLPNIAVTATDVYYGSSTGIVERLSKNDSFLGKQLATGLLPIGELTVSDTDLLWSPTVPDGGVGGLGTIPLDGGKLAYQSHQWRVEDVVYDATTYYFSDLAGLVYRVPRKLTAAPTFVASGRFLAGDDAFLYTTVAQLDGTSNVVRMNKDGKAPVTIAEHQVDVVCVAVDDTYAYWSTNDSNIPAGLRRAPKDGGGQVESLYDTTDKTTIVAVDASTIVFFDYDVLDQASQTLHGTIWQMAKNGGAPVQLIAPTLMNDLGLDARYVYWVTVDGLYRVAR